MKVNLKNIIGLAALGMTLLTTTTPTWAGRVSNDSVRIGNNQFSSWASGNLEDARSSADSQQWIGCKAQTLKSYSWTICQANDSTGRYLTCGSGDWKFLDMVQGMTDSSYIFFQTDRNAEAGYCTDIRIYNSSELLK